MLYRELAETYEKLEATTKKLEKTEIVKDILLKSGNELRMVVYLLAGRVFPIWDKKETGVASNLMIKALSKSTGISEGTVTEIFRETGDLGKTAELLASKRKQKTLLTKTLTVREVFETIRKICYQEGSGSQERKLSLLARLLSFAEPLEARYIVRTVLEELRVGVAEGILRDAISLAFNVRPETVESAWFLNPDFGEIAELARKGEEALKNVGIKFGRPIMVLLAEKARSLEEALNAYENPAVEMKYDGARIIIEKDGDKIWLFTRRLENVTEQFPELVEYSKKCLPERCIVDGECIAVSESGRPLPFQVLSQRIQRKYGIDEVVKKIPVQMNLFDIIYLGDELLFETPFRKRRELLEKAVKTIPGKFQLAEHLRTKDLKKAEEFYRKSLELGEEGVMVKNLDAGYQPGRRVGYWLKVKPVMENLDLVIIGAEYGTGKRAGWFGSFILGCRDPDTGEFLECGMLGTGIKEKKTSDTDITFEELTELLKPLVVEEKDRTVRFKPKIVVEVAYEEIQKSPNYSSGFALRFPRFVRLRPDKSPEEADTIERISRLYESQRK
ncbi:MAG: ATP-dependent DNA ligase [Candidatus Micrarchaeota archaeon]|nr:ATP-dependent DNA ligase [Candidatus Micrarchaeota archaeon]